MEEQEGISIKEFFKIVFSQKWLALAITVVLTIVCVLGCWYIYNPYVSDYVVSFKLNLPGDNSNGAAYNYPDGSPFFYTSLISEDTLTSIKESREEFSSINVENMVKTTSISITENLKVTSLSSAESLVERNYTISVSCKYFPDKETAKQFLTAVASHPAKYLAEMTREYDSLLKLYKDADDYLKQVNFLESQLEYLETEYEKLMETYSGDFVIEKGKSLKAYSDELKAYGNSFEFINLLPELKTLCYLKNENIKDAYRLELMRAESELEKETFILENTLLGKSEATVADSTGKSQAAKVAELKRQVQDLQKFINDGVVDSQGVFAVRLDRVYDKLSEYTQTFKTASNKVYSNTVGVFFTDVNVVTVDGNISLVKVIILSVVVALIIAIIVAFAVGATKRKKVLAAKSAEKAEKTQISENPENIN